MDNVLKRRLIGASILIALAVIFLPMLLVGPEPELDDRRLSEPLPEMPAGDREVRRIPLDPDLARVPPSRVDETAAGVDGRGSAPAGESAITPADPRASMDSPSRQAPPDEIVLNPSGGDRSSDAARPADAEPPVPDPAEGGLVDVERSDVGAPGAEGAAAADEAAGDSGQAAVAPSGPGSTERRPVVEAAPSAGDGNWVVQVASFGSQDSSQATRERLEALGHPVITDEVVRGDTMLYRLRTGPYADRARAETARGQIAATVAGVEPIVREVSDAELQATPGFAVQVGSFASEENAERETARLRNLGFDAFRQSEDASGRAIWKVLVGTVEDRSEAETLRGRLVDEAGVEGLIVSHP
ncbi:SPOR domain-containing protein [Halomonas denitrificans]|nr:SPOR domain-containing protein [Halomonas denitrificans]